MKENFDDTLFASEDEVEVGGSGVSGPAAEGSFSEDSADADSATEDSSVEDDEQGMFEHFRLNVDVGQTPLRIDKYMACHLMDTSRHRVQCAIRNGYVRLGDKVAKAVADVAGFGAAIFQRDLRFCLGMKYDPALFAEGDI